MADRSSLLVAGLHAVTVQVVFAVSSGLQYDQESAERPRKDQDLGSGLGLTYVSVSFLVVVGGTIGEGGVHFSAWISVQFARGSAFYDLTSCTVAKDRGPYDGN